MANKLRYNPSTIGEQSPENIGTYHLADNPNLYEIQRSNNFMFIVDMSVNNAIKAGFGADEPDKVVSNAQQVIKMAVSEASVPHFQQSVIEVRRGNSTLKFAGVPTFPSGSISCIDYIGAEVKEALMAWQNLSYNVETEKVGLSQDYKKDCTLVEYSPDYQVVRRWKLYGCWISNISEDNYSSERNDKKNISVTIEYDKAKIDVSGEI